MRWSLLLLSASLLLGAISKQIGMALESGLASVTEVEKLLTSQEGNELMEAMSVEPRKLVHALAEPFLWPLSVIIRRGGEQGIADYLSSDKRLVRMFCWQIYFNLFHAIAAVAAIVVLACSMKSP